MNNLKILFVFGCVFANNFCLAKEVIHDKDELSRPKNNHGIEPTVFIQGEQLLTPNNSITHIPILSTEWSISFNIRYFGTVDDGESNIILLTDGSVERECGYAIPAVFTYPEKPVLYMVSCMNSVGHSMMKQMEIPMHVKTKIEIHQRYVKNGQYRLFTLLDGKLIMDEEIKEVRQFYNVEVFASNGILPPSKAYISNFQLTNFL